MSTRILAGPVNLTVSNRRGLMDYAADCIAAGDRHVVLDCSVTCFIDSTGLNAIFWATKHLAAVGGRFELCGLNEDLSTLLELTKLDTVLNISDELPAAPADSWPLSREEQMVGISNEAALIATYLLHHPKPGSARDIQRFCDLTDETFNSSIKELIHRRVLDWENDVAAFRDEAARTIFRRDYKLVQTKQRLRAFLCHSSDDKPRVMDIYRNLGDDGFIPWLDTEDLLPGQEWAEEISNAVRRSHVVLVFMSCESVTKTGYFQKEIKYALDVADEQPEGTIYIIPIRLELCTVPKRLQRWHWVDLFSENGHDQLLNALKAREENLHGIYRLA